MAKYKIDDVYMRLFHSVAATERDFEPSSYMARTILQPTNRDKINFVYKDMEKHNLLPAAVEDAKSDALAQRHRENGHREYSLGRYFAALKSCNCSLALAQSEHLLVLAYADRSACLYRLGMYRQCVMDIDRVMQYNCPTELREKLIIRRNLARNLEKSMESYYEEVPNIRDSQKSPTIQCASSSVRIESNVELGTHIVATRDIEIGEVISVEEPFAAVVSNDRLLHCHECLELCYNMIPCENCTRAFFCSDYCKAKAHAYHVYECPILLSLESFGMNSNLIALKVALLAKKDYSFLHSFRFDKNDYYRSDSYKEIYCLKIPVRQGGIDDVFKKTVMGAVLWHLLKTNTNFCENQTIEDFCKELLLHQLEATSMNATKISEYSRNSICYGRNYFADGLYSFFSLFKHSCCNNVVRTFYGPTMVLRAINTIRRGEHCSINYGCHYATSEKSTRQTVLSKHYNLRCACVACKQDWKPDMVNFTITPEFMVLQAKLTNVDVDFAKRILRWLYAQLKLCERFEPRGRALTWKVLILQCLETLGNKRRM